MIPSMDEGEYRTSIVFANGQTTEIPLKVLPFKLPDGITPDSVIADIDQSIKSKIQTVTGFMENGDYAQTNLNTLNYIVTGTVS